jgi:uncharacterized protein (TIGR02246 family)
MKRSHTSMAFSWLLAAFLLSCERVQVIPSNAASTSGLDTLRESALQALIDADEAWDRSTTLSADSFVSFFADDALWLWVDGRRLSGMEEIRTFTRQARERPGSLDWEPTSIGVNDTYDVGYTAGEWQSSYRAEGGEVIETVGSYMAIWKKGEDGEWKVKIEIEFPGLGVFQQPLAPSKQR